MSDRFVEFVENLLRGKPSVPATPAGLDAEFARIVERLDTLGPSALGSDAVPPQVPRD